MNLRLNLKFTSVSIDIITSTWKRASAMAPSNNSYKILTSLQIGDVSIKVNFTRSPSFFSNIIFKSQLNAFRRFKNISGSIYIDMLKKSVHKANIGINFEDTVKVILSPFRKKNQGTEMSKVQFDSECSKLTGTHYNKIEKDLVGLTTFDIYYQCICKLILSTDGYYPAETATNKQLLLLKSNKAKNSVKIFLENILFVTIFENYV
uniref:Ruby (inferred by orthology to a D. melanogaster protein) n=1 Tax=Strongyloides venezuelensis TaxID=75913 RepID=A0A0K0FED1_STRVS